MLTWLKRILSFMPGEYWSSIDEMPLYNWIKCNNGKLEFTRITKKGNKVQDYIHWKRLYNEYLTEFGLDTRYKKYLDAQKKKALLQSEYVITKERFKLTEIEIQEQRIKDLEVHFAGGGLHALAWLSRCEDEDVHSSHRQAVESLGPRRLLQEGPQLRGDQAGGLLFSLGAKSDG